MITRVRSSIYLTNGFSHHYHLSKSTFIFRGVRSDFYFLSHFSMKFLCANRIAPDGTPRSAASHLGLFGLPMSHKKGRQAYELTTQSHCETDGLVYQQEFFENKLTTRSS